MNDQQFYFLLKNNLKNYTNLPPPSPPSPPLSANQWKVNDWKFFFKKKNINLNQQNYEYYVTHENSFRSCKFMIKAFYELIDDKTNN